MVDFDRRDEIVELWVRGRTGVEVVDLCVRHVRRGHQRENFLRGAHEPVGGNLVVGELLADEAAVAVRTGRLRIENRDDPTAAARELAEISVAKRRRRKGNRSSARSREFVEELLPKKEELIKWNEILKTEIIKNKNLVNVDDDLDLTKPQLKININFCN